MNKFQQAIKELECEGFQHYRLYISWVDFYRGNCLISKLYLPHRLPRFKVKVNFL